MTSRDPASRRESDAEHEDWTATRRPVEGDEVKIGIGNKSLTLRGSMVISVVGILAMLGLIAYHIREQEREAQRGLTLMAEEHRHLAETLNRALRLQTCVLSMTAEERLDWRRRSGGDAFAVLIAFCPGLLLAPGPVIDK